MGWRRYVRPMLILSALGLVLALGLLPSVFGSRAATEPTETVRSAGIGQDEPLQDTQSRDPAPPKRPPEAALLLNSGASREPSARQLGVPVYHNWWINGKREAYEMEPPISWPEPLAANAADEVVIDLGTRVMPQTVEVRLYGEVGPGGIPAGDPTELLTCQPTLGDSSSGPCAMSRRTNPGDEDRQFVLPTSSWEGKRFMAVWVAWPALPETYANSGGPPVVYSAAWLFSLEAVQ